ncbi:hypothetical protein [Mesorhizobium sangaii]|uniref:Uncharacterized protein n=1 Tax=Mesorhizobium sangaii TaxID=505389 RepID=A0A841PBL4_9HYPH|nr:hypothetical protein [Mesorhizobium sangaii]MBB6412546.1 hypothetical protein [Mesorhizobium sangaii]
MADFNIGFDGRYAERRNSGAVGFAWIRSAAAGLVELVHLADLPSASGRRRCG